MNKTRLLTFLISIPILVSADLVLRLDAGNLPAGALSSWSDSSNNAFGGEIAEVLVFNDTLTSDERAGLEHLVAERWNVSGPAAATQIQIDAANALFPGGAYAIPEPSSLGMLLFAGTLLWTTRRSFRRTNK